MIDYTGLVALHVKALTATARSFRIRIIKNELRTYIIFVPI